MITGKTPSGVEYTISEERFDNWELIEAFSNLESERDVNGLKRILNLMLGEGTTKQIMQNLREEREDPAGKFSYLPPEKVTADIMAVIENAGTVLKKS